MMASVKSHKSTAEHHGWLLNLYYSNRIVLGLTCLGNEFFYIFLYVCHFYRLSELAVVGGHSLDVLRLAALACAPVFALKQWLNLVQLRCSASDIVHAQQLAKRS